jgi:chitin disaccharide deacetylase
MKFLIVNGDDFGMSPGINRGILEAHRRGILSSASLMVDAPASEEAAALLATAPDLSVGLHVELCTGPAGALADGCRTQLEHQLARFQALTGRLPTHLDSHHDVHRKPAILPHVADLAGVYGLPLRGHGAVRCCSKFYGQWDGETHLAQVSVAGFARILEREIHDGVTELACHPGYVDATLRSSYRVEREAELRTLCDPAVRQALARRGIPLVNFRDVRNLPGDNMLV